MGGLSEGCKEHYSQQVGCIIKLALRKKQDLRPKPHITQKDKNTYTHAPFMSMRATIAAMSRSSHNVTSR
jgi:hypothetical protein